MTQHALALATEAAPPPRCGLCLREIRWERIETDHGSDDPDPPRVSWIAGHECRGGVTHLRWEAK